MYRHTKSRVGKVRPAAAGQIRPKSSVHLARGCSSVLSFNIKFGPEKVPNDERDLVAYWETTLIGSLTLVDADWLPLHLILQSLV